MRDITSGTMTRLLNRATTGKLCVKTWLAHANIIIVGFGDVVMPPPTLVDIPGKKPRYKHSGHPPYELVTEFAHWWVERDGVNIGTRYQEELIEAAAASLLGKRVVRWRFLPPHWGLRIEFEEALVLQIVPSDPTEATEDIWGMWDSNNYRYIVRPDGSMYKKHGDEPV